MTKKPQLSLFDEVTAAADALRRNDPDLREALMDELKLTFREIQRRRAPQLLRAEWVDLFKTWAFEYFARNERRRQESIADMIAAIDRYARANKPSKFVCPCGKALENPGDPAVMAIHQPHYLAAKAAR